MQTVATPTIEPRVELSRTEFRLGVVTVDRPKAAVLVRDSVAELLTSSTGGQTLLREIDDLALQTTRNFRSVARKQFISENRALTYAAPASSVGSLVAGAGVFEGASMHLLSSGSAIAAGTGAALLGLGAAATFVTKNRAAVSAIADADHQAAEARLDERLDVAIRDAGANALTAFAYADVARRLAKHPPKGFARTSERHAKLNRLIALAQNITPSDRQRAERFGTLSTAIAEASRTRVSRDAMTQALEYLRKVFEALPASEQQGLAQHVMTAVFDERELPRAPASREAASRLYRKLASAASEPAALPHVDEPMTADPTERFCEQMLAFEADLSAAIDASARTLSRALWTLSGSRERRESDYSMALVGGTRDWLRTKLVQWKGTADIRHHGLDPQLVTQAVARASASWATPLERSGFAFIASRHLNALDKTGIHATFARDALRRVVAAGTGTTSHDLVRAKKLCRCLFLLNELAPDTSETVTDRALKDFKRQAASDQSAIARAALPYVFDGNTAQRTQASFASLSRALHDAIAL